MRTKRERLDVLLVQRGLAESRARAQALILAGLVVVADRRVDKAGTLVEVDAEIRLKGEAIPYVSRGGLKLKAAIDHFALDVRGAVCADLGASTGGFTDCLLQAGAVRVYAIDVGYGQLHERLRCDPRVISRERVNARALGKDELPEPIDVLVADVSFISLRLVLPNALEVLKPKGLVAVLVKPQFELGPERVGKGGVVRDAALRREAVEGIGGFLVDQGLELTGDLESPIAGPAGNIESMLVARKP